MNRKTMLIIPIAVSIFLGGTIIAVFAHSEPDELRFFERDFCADENTILSDRTYIDGHELSYDSSDCPRSTITIHNWDDISVAQRTIIDARMTTAGYNDITTQVLGQ